MLHFDEFLKSWSLRSNSVTRQVNFNRTKINGKCQNSNATFWVIFKQCALGTIFGWFLSGKTNLHYWWYVTGGLLVSWSVCVSKGSLALLSFLFIGVCAICSKVSEMASAGRKWAFAFLQFCSVSVPFLWFFSSLIISFLRDFRTKLRVHVDLMLSCILSKKPKQVTACKWDFALLFLLLARSCKNSTLLLFTDLLSSFSN